MAGADWSALTLEVTQRLLEAEGRRLDSQFASCHGGKGREGHGGGPQRRLSSSSQKSGESLGEGDGVSVGTGEDDAAMQRLRLQYSQLEAEYARSTSLLLGGGQHRSQPALGIRVGKRRPSIDLVNPTARAPRRGSESSTAGADPANPDAERTGSGVATKRGAYRTEIGCGGSGGVAEAGGAVGEADPTVELSGRVVCGTIEGLTRHFLGATPSVGGNRLFNFTFVTVFRLYLSPAALMTVVEAEVKQFASGSGGSTSDTATRGAAHGGSRFGTTSRRRGSGGSETERRAEALDAALRAWAENAPADFRSSGMQLRFSKVCEALASAIPSRKEASDLTRQLLEDRLAALDAATQERRAEFRLQLRRKSATLPSDRARASESCKLFELGEHAVDPTRLAKQLTFAEQRRFARIETAEFVSTVGEEAQTAGAANLRAYVDWFNRLSWLVAAGICQCGHKKTRVRLIEHWIEVGRACRGMRNYNSTMAVVSALNMASVRRMKRTWASVKSKSRSQLQELEGIFDPTGNFKTYRTEVGAISVTEPCLPFFSLIVRDVYFSQEASTSKAADGTINWERFEPVAKRLAEFASGRTATWAISPDLAVQEYLTTAVVPTEEELFQDSLAFEPAEDARRASATLKRSRSRESTEKAVVRASSSEVTDSSVSTASDVRTGGRGSGVSDPTSVTASAAKRPTVLASQAAVPTQQLESDGDDTDSFEC